MTAGGIFGMFIRGIVLAAAAVVMAVVLVAPAVAADAVPANSVPRNGNGAAQTRQERPAVQAPTTPSPDFEDTPLSFPTTNRQQMRQSRSGVPSVFSALFYVVIICAIFFFVIYLFKRYVPGQRQFFNHPALEVLGRTHLDQRRFVSLVRVGRRVLVLGVTADEITPLTEIDNELEVTEILEHARPKTEAGKSMFAKLFQRHVIEAHQAEAAGELDSQAEALADDITELRNRIRSE